MIDFEDEMLKTKEGRQYISDEYDRAVSKSNNAADRLVASGVGKYAGSDTDDYGNSIKTVSYDVDEAGGYGQHAQSSTSSNDVAKESSAGPDTVNASSGNYYSRSPDIEGLRAQQAEDLETERKRFTPTESVDVGDGLNRSVFGRMVRYTDNNGKVVKWGEIDANGNETSSEGPESAKIQSEMDARTKEVKNGKSIGRAMSDDSKLFSRAAVWNSALNSQRMSVADETSAAYGSAIEAANRVRADKMAKKRDQRLVASEAFAVAANGLKGEVQRDKETGNITDPRLEKEEDENGVTHYYIANFVGRDELGSVNARRKNAGSMDEYDGVMARYEVDKNGNKIGDVEFGVRDSVGGVAGDEKSFTFRSSSYVARLLEKDLMSRGVSQSDAQHQIVNTVLGGISNPFGWNTNQGAVLKNAQAQRNFSEGKNLATNDGSRESVELDKNDLMGRKLASDEERQIRQEERQERREDRLDRREEAADENAKKQMDMKYKMGVLDFVEKRIAAADKVLSDPLATPEAKKQAEEERTMYSIISGSFIANGGNLDNSGGGSGDENGSPATSADAVMKRARAAKKPQNGGGSESPVEKPAKTENPVKPVNEYVVEDDEEEDSSSVKMTRSEERAEAESNLDRDGILSSRMNEWKKAGGSEKTFGRGYVLDGDLEDYLLPDVKAKYKKGIEYLDDNAMSILDSALDQKTAYEDAYNAEENKTIERYKKARPYAKWDEVEKVAKYHMKIWEKKNPKNKPVKKS